MMALGLGLGLTMQRGGAGALDPLTLFADGTDGFDFDFQQTDRLFGTGTDAGRGEGDISAPGDQIGFAFDGHAWGGRSLAAQLALQPELVTNGDFSSAAGFNISRTGAAAEVIAGGQARVQRIDSVSQSNLRQSFATEAGAWYIAQWDVLASSATGNLRSGFGTSEYGIQLVNGAARNGRNVFGATGATSWLVFSGLSDGADLTFDNLSVKRVHGKRAVQTNNSFRPLWQTIGAADFTGDVARFMVTSHVPTGPAHTLIAQAVIPATIAADQVIMGTRDAAGGRLAVGVNASGRAIGMVGDHDGATIVGTTDIRGEAVTIQLVHDGSTVTLYVNGVAEYTGVQSGVPNTTIPLMIGALNNNGTAASHFNGAAFRLTMADKAA